MAESRRRSSETVPISPEGCMGSHQLRCERQVAWILILKRAMLRIIRNRGSPRVHAN